MILPITTTLLHQLPLTTPSRISVVAAVSSASAVSSAVPTKLYSAAIGTCRRYRTGSSCNNSNSSSITHQLPISYICGSSRKDDAAIQLRWRSLQQQQQRQVVTATTTIALAPFNSIRCLSTASASVATPNTSLSPTISPSLPSSSISPSLPSTSSSSSNEQEQQSKTTTPSLTLWKQMIQTIPIHRIVPIGMIPTTLASSSSSSSSSSTTPLPQQVDDIANRTAFFGDKVLNYYISQALRRSTTTTTTTATMTTTTPPIQNVDGSTNGANGSNGTNFNDYTIASTYTGIDIGYLTLVQSEAMSNQLYSTLFTDIMGSHPEMTDHIRQLAQSQQQIHDAGTMVEATVYELLNHPPSSTTSKYTKLDAVMAVQELAAYLVHYAYETTTYFNAKGQLLELGGTVISYKTEDSIVHCPKFRAIATYNQLSTISDPPSATKKMAEQIAATQLLKQCNFSRVQPVVKQRITFVNTNNSQNINTGNGEALVGDDDAATNTNDVELVNFDVDLMEDGALPDDFYSDITTITKQTAGGANNDSDDNDDTVIRPYDAQRFQLPKLQKRLQCDFYHFNNTHTVNLKDGESPELSWRRGAYDKRSCFHRAVLSSKMLPHHVETVNSWTRPNSKESFTVVVVVIPKRKPNDTSIFPTVKCFVRHDQSRNRARNALGLVINQYIDQVVIGHSVTELQMAQRQRAIQPDRRIWPPKETRKNKVVSSTTESITRGSRAYVTEKLSDIVVEKEHDSWYDTSNGVDADINTNGKSRKSRADTDTDADNSSDNGGETDDDHDDDHDVDHDEDDNVPDESTESSSSSSVEKMSSPSLG